MPDAAVLPRSKEKLVMSVLCERIEDVLKDGNKEGARALMPQLSLLAGKLRRLRARGADFSGLGVSEYVHAVAALAGRADEFAEFA